MRSDVFSSFNTGIADGIHELPLRLGQILLPQLLPRLRLRLRAPVGLGERPRRNSQNTQDGDGQTKKQRHAINDEAIDSINKNPCMEQGMTLEQIDSEQP